MGVTDTMSAGEGYIINGHNQEVKPEALRVYRVLSSQLKAEQTDFSILGFRKMSPGYVKGRKVLTQYLDNVLEEVIVEKIFIDVIDENGLLIGLEITFNWYSENGDVGVSKTEIVKNYNATEAEEEYEKRRRRQIRFLKASAKAKPGFGPYVDLLFAHFYQQIEAYKDPGTNAFKVSMENETDPTIRTILDTVFDSETGATVQQLIIAELYT